MIKRKPQILLSSLGHWFLYNCLLMISSLVLPEKTAAILWINCSIYFLIGLLSLKIIVSDQFNKDIFTNIGILFIWISLSQLAACWLHKLVNDPTTLIGIKFYQIFSVPFFSAFAIIYLALKYLFQKCPIIFLYLITFLITSVIVVFNLMPGWHYIQFEQVAENAYIKMSLFRINILILLFILVYAFKVYVNDRPTGEYLHLLVVGFFFWVINNLLGNLPSFFSAVQSTANQYLLFINLIFLGMILLKKLNYSTSEFSKFYEQQIYGTGKIGDVAIQRRGKANINFYIELGNQIFQKRRNITLILGGWVVIHTAIKIPTYLSLNFSINFVCIILLFLFSFHLFQRRQRRGNLIHN